MQQGDEETGATIRIDKGTYERLVKNAAYKDTVDSIVKKKLECYEKRPEAKEFVRVARDVEKYHRPIKGIRTIRISDDTYQMLGMMGTNVLTYDDIIRMLIKDAMTKPEIKALMDAAKKLEKFDKSRIKSGEWTTVRIKMSTYNRLVNLGTTATTINNIMDRILNVCEN